MPSRSSLIERIARMRREAAANDPQTTREARASKPEETSALEQRVAHLEMMVEGLQDSVHREFKRQRDMLAEHEAQLEPSALAIVLQQNARERGL